MDLNSPWGFYLSWHSLAKSDGVAKGTSGNAYCSPVQAQYNFKVRTIILPTSFSLIFSNKYQLKVQTKGGIQSVNMTSVTQTTPIPDVRRVENMENKSMSIFWAQLASITYATRALFLGHTSVSYHPGGTLLTDTRPAGQPSFLEIPLGSGIGYIWGDVLKGIEETSHNVSAGLLTLQLGNMSSSCTFDRRDVQIYHYTSFELWVPYGVSTMLYCRVMISTLWFYRWPWVLL